jgi:hypothetical protein
MYVASVTAYNVNAALHHVTRRELEQRGLGAQQGCIYWCHSDPHSCYYLRGLETRESFLDREASGLG